MKNVNKLFIASTLFISLNVFANDVNVKGLDLIKGSASSQLNVKLTGNLNDNPEFKINGKNLELKIPNAHIAGKISKKVGDITLVAAQIDRSTVKVVAVLPESLKGNENLVSITLKDNAVDLTFPNVEAKVVQNKIGRAPAIIKEESNKNSDANLKEAEKLDENYLQNLEKEHVKLAEEKHKGEDLAIKNEKTDGVKLSQSGVEKSQTNGQSTTGEGAKSSFSVATYIGKFVAFLSVILLGFYGVLTLMKKGVIKKGKLGFLNSTKLVEVLSTTHVAPKRTLIMVKAHKQVFLIANSESGMNLISEINDLTGLIKNGEEELTGSNFDTNLITANKTEKEFRLKNEDYVDYESLDEMLNDTDDYETTNAAKAIERKPVKDSVRFSDQIKTKVKNLKQI